MARFLTYEERLTAMCLAIAALAGPGQSEYAPTAAGIDGGMSVVCSFPGGAVSVDTTATGRVKVHVSASDRFDRDRVTVCVLNHLPIRSFKQEWAEAPEG